MNPVSKRNRDARIRLHREIIEIGAIKLDEGHNVVDKFRCYVKPQFDSEITPFITSLTGITSYEVCGACCFEDALFAFEKWIGYLSQDEVWITAFGLLLDLWECHRQYNGLAQPKREHFIDNIIPDGI